MMYFNWLQAMENFVDPLHAEWLHGHFANSVRSRQGKSLQSYSSRRHVKIAFDAFEYGIVKRRVFEGGNRRKRSNAVPEVTRFLGAGIPAGAIHTVSTVFSDRQVRECDMLELATRCS